MQRVHIDFSPAVRGEPNRMIRETFADKIWQLIRFSVVTGLIFVAAFALINFDAYKLIVLDFFNPEARAMSQVALQKVVGNVPDPLPVLPTTAREVRPSFSYVDFPVVPTDHRLIIPKLGTNIPIVEMGTEHLEGEDWPALEKQIQAGLQKGVVHYPGTAKPGEFGNVFITGHSSFYPWDPGQFKDVFALLGKLDPGDDFYLYYNQRRYAYRVDAKFEVQPANVSVLEQPKNQKQLTLMTCTPVGTTLRRLIVTAVQV